MIKILLSEEFDGSLEKLPKHIRRKAVKRVKIFQENPFHPGLRAEKINPPQLNIWSFRIDRNYRILFRFVESNIALFILADHHKNIYRYHELR